MEQEEIKEESKVKLSFEEKLDKLPDEFTYLMEKYKESHFLSVIKTVKLYLGKENDFDDLEPPMQDLLMQVFRMLHNYGFYGGVNFTLDPEEEFEETKI